MEENNKDTVYVGLEKVPLKSEREENKKKKKNTFLTIVICALFLVLGIVLGIIYCGAIHPMLSSNASNVISEIEAILDRNWIYAVDHENLQEEMENKAYYGMTAFEEDPYTTYMSPEELDSFSTGINMDYVGIGVQYVMNDDMALIERVFMNSPAQNAGLQVGDVIDSIDGVSVSGLTSDEIKERVIGEEGTVVVIGVIRDNKKIDIPVTRGSVDNSVYCYAENDYVVLELISFGNNTCNECIKYLDQYSDYDKLIIDLRGDTGGYQTAVQEICGLFVGDGVVYLRQKDSKGVETADLTKCPKTYDNFKKIILLVDGETASAAEVFTICLKEYLDYVTIVGETTYGKGVIQTTNYLLGGGVLKYSSFYWYSPNGTSIHKEGIKPDVEVMLDDIAYEYYYDMEDDEKYEFDSVSSVVDFCEKSLSFLGYEVDRTDGYFDKSFENALRKYQKDNNLPDNGVIDNNTYKSIISDVKYELTIKEKDKQLQKAIELISQ